MTDFDGYVNEMPVAELDDRALNAVLNGASSAESEFEWLIPFVDDLGALATAPPPVLKPALATLLAEGFSIEKGDLPATAASNVTGPARQAAGLPKWRKKLIVSELLAGIAAKLAGLGIAAKAGLGLTVAAASVTSAGAAGVLPDPVQHAVANTVEASTPFSFPDAADDDGTKEDKAKKHAGEDDSGEDDSGEDDGTVHGADHPGLGSIVSADARGESDGVKGVDGQVISDLAKGHHDGQGNGHDDGDDDATDDDGDDDATEDQGGKGVGPSGGTTGHDRADQTPAGEHGQGHGGHDSEQSGP